MSKIVQGVYRHFKGKQYFVLGVAKHSETQEEMVVYVCLYENENGAFWVRPLSIFDGFVDVDGKKVKRFVKVEI